MLFCFMEEVIIVSKYKHNLVLPKNNYKLGTQPPF